MNIPTENPDSGYDKSDLEYQPNQKKHLYVSFAKSAIRIAAGVVMLFSEPLIVMAGLLLIVAECLGILEEVV